MPDFDLQWGGDLVLTPSGDVATVDGDEFTRQQIVRRLLTAVHGYDFHPSYGAGLPQRIGRTAQERVIQALVRSQILLEASVAQAPVPTIKVTGSASGLFVIDIRYTDAVSGVAAAISFEVPGSR